MFEVGGDVASERRLVGGGGDGGCCDGAVGDAVLMPVGWGDAAEGGLAVFGFVSESVHFGIEWEMALIEKECRRSGLLKG